MCRSIKTLRNAEVPATETEIRAAALQFVRKVSGYRKPLVRQAKLGVSRRVKVPVEEGLTSHSYRVLQ